MIFTSSEIVAKRSWISWKTCINFQFTWYSAFAEELFLFIHAKVANMQKFLSSRLASFSALLHSSAATFTEFIIFSHEKSQSYLARCTDSHLLCKITANITSLDNNVKAFLSIFNGFIIFRVKCEFTLSEISTNILLSEVLTSVKLCGVLHTLNFYSVFIFNSLMHCNLVRAIAIYTHSFYAHLLHFKVNLSDFAPHFARQCTKITRK